MVRSRLPNIILTDICDSKKNPQAKFQERNSAPPKHFGDGYKLQVCLASKVVFATGLLIFTNAVNDSLINWSFSLISRWTLLIEVHEEQTVWWMHSSALAHVTASNWLETRQIPTKFMFLWCNWFHRPQKLMWYIVADIVAVTARRLSNVNAVSRHFSLLPLFVEREVDNNVTRTVSWVCWQFQTQHCLAKVFFFFLWKRDLSLRWYLK